MPRLLALTIFGLLMASSHLYGGNESPFLDDPRWRQARDSLAEGRPKAAREALQDLLKEYPEEPDLHLLTAIASLRLRELGAAEVHVRRALGLAPDHPEARTLLGWINLEARRDFPAAIDAYARVVEARPDSPEAHNNLGVALKKGGDLDRAIESFSRALTLREGYAEAWSNRGWVHLEAKRWGEAEDDFNRALSLRQDDEGALYGLSRARRGARDYAGAQEALRLLISRAPNFVYWLEWAELVLVRYYWALLLVAAGFFLRARYRKMRAKS